VTTRGHRDANTPSSLTNQKALFSAGKKKDIFIAGVEQGERESYKPASGDITLTGRHITVVFSPPCMRKTSAEITPRR